ncbi:MAG: adenylate cyclase, partial [Mesorhizobium sp.]
AALTRAIADSIANGELGFAAEAARRLHLLDPLNEAASRAIMQAEAEAGQTVQALRRYQGLRDRLRAELGVKPAPETIRLYEAIRDRAAEEPVSAVSPVLPSTAEMPLPERPAVAVLPFENLSGDADQQYFSDGISEDIITELSRFRSLFVIARHSSFAFKGRPVKVQEIARELGVAYVVEGSFRRVGDRVRISAQLVDAGRGTQLWAEKYDRELVDIFAVQDDVARSV